MKILIVQTAFIGDVLLSLPLIEALRQNYKNIEIHFLTIPSSKNLVETQTGIHKLWIYDKHKADRGVAKYWRFARLLRREKYDCAIVPHRSLRSASLVYFSKIKQRIGFNKSAGRFLFTKIVEYDKTAHEIDRNLALLTDFQIDPDIKYLPKINFSGSDNEKTNQWLKERQIDGGKPILALAPGSVWYTKRWPIRFWRELGKLFSKIGYVVVYIGSSEDAKSFSGEIENEDPNILNAMGEFTLRESAVIIQNSRLLISNDSSPTHIAVGTDSPVLTIFGATSPEFGFYPYLAPNNIIQITNLNCKPCAIHGGKNCPEKHFKCMLELSPEMVFKKAKVILNDYPDGS